MAVTTKKYVSLEKLGLYDGKIKGIITTGDETTLQAAKDYADGLATNYDAKGAATTAKNEATAYTDAQINALKTGEIKTAKDTADAAVAAAGVADGKAVAAQTAADKAQGEVDALEKYVGTIPEGADATDVIAYIDSKTEGIATDAALGQLQATVTQLGKDIDAVEADYLVGQDKADLQANIDTEKGRIDTLVGTDTNKSVRTIATDVLTEALVADNAKEAYDTLEEMSAWIQAHPEDATAMNAAIGALETLVGEIPADATATDIVAYIQEVVAAEKTRAEGIENGLAGRISTLEGKFGDGEGSVEDLIADAQANAEATAAADATTKANQALADAKTYTNGQIETVNADIETLEATAHSHSNKTLLDTYTQAETDLADAVAKKHSHANGTVLEGITSEKVSLWDTVSSKAAQTALQAEIDRATAAEQANAEAIAAFVECSQEDINNLFV